jgi:nucleoside-diphosphate-sugar epimerase
MTPGIAVVALRYGFFYGPSTWFSGDGDVGEQVRRRQVPVIGDGQGVWSWVHIEDARDRRRPRMRAGRLQYRR